MRTALYAVIVLLLINGIIFIFRHKGFEYQAFSTVEELCAQGQDTLAISKWTKPGSRFNPAEIREAQQILEREIELSKFTDTDSLAIAIGAWLFGQFSPYSRKGPEPFMSSLTALQQLYAVKEGKSNVWCGNYQYVFGFLCTAAGIQNRYIELVPLQAVQGPHVINEFWSPRSRSWAMSDVTRDKIMVLDESGLPLCAAQYYERMVSDSSSRKKLIVITHDSRDTMHKGNVNDPYFTTGYKLHYYYETNNMHIYTWPAKLERYFLARPWYVQYPRPEKDDNRLFYLKQFFAVMLLLSVLLLLYLYFKQRR